jgi:hypothetical protein
MEERGEMEMIEGKCGGPINGGWEDKGGSINGSWEDKYKG